MWGICLDMSLCEGALFQRVIEYQIKERNTAIIIQPTTNIEIDIQLISAIDKPPKFKYGDLVSPANNTDKKGKVRDIVWHFKNNTFNYYIEIDNKKVSRRYSEEELVNF